MCKALIVMLALLALTFQDASAPCSLTITRSPDAESNVNKTIRNALLTQRSTQQHFRLR